MPRWNWFEKCLHYDYAKLYIVYYTLPNIWILKIKKDKRKID